MLATDKKKALEIYEEAKKAYLESRTNEKWIAFCDAKAVCMRLGVRI